jgi:hypothetical protein
MKIKEIKTLEIKKMERKKISVMVNANQSFTQKL